MMEEFETDEPRESVDLAIISLRTANQLLGDAIRFSSDPLTHEQLRDAEDRITHIIDALRNIGI